MQKIDRIEEEIRRRQAQESQPVRESQEGKPVSVEDTGKKDLSEKIRSLNS
jgi:hypothetical protein